MPDLSGFNTWATAQIIAVFFMAVAFIAVRHFLKAAYGKLIGMILLGAVVYILIGDASKILRPLQAVVDSIFKG